MRLSNLTTLLVPILLSSVLAAPTPVRHDNVDGGALAARSLDTGTCNKDYNPGFEEATMLAAKNAGLAAPVQVRTRQAGAPEAAVQDPDAGISPREQDVEDLEA